MIERKNIVKFANLRLYDSDNQVHVTLSDIRKMIVAGADLKFVDDVSGDDITISLLTQIILDKERSRKYPPTAVLRA